MIWHFFLLFFLGIVGPTQLFQNDTLAGYQQIRNYAKTTLMRVGKTARKIALFNFAAMCSSLFFLSGCGYSLQGRVKENFRPIQGVFVPVFSNQTDEVGAEVVFTNAVIRELESRGGIALTQRQPGARELKGTVTSINYYPTTSTEVGAKGLMPYRRLPTELMVEASVYVSLVHPETKQVLWSSSFSSFRRVPMPLDRTYNFQAASSVGLMTQSYIQSQYPLIARDVSRDIYDSILLEEEG